MSCMWIRNKELLLLMSDDDPSCSHSDIDMKRMICKDCYHRWYDRNTFMYYLIARGLMK